MSRPQPMRWQEDDGGSGPECGRCGSDLCACCPTCGESSLFCDCEPDQEQEAA